MIRFLTQILVVRPNALVEVAFSIEKIDIRRFWLFRDLGTELQETENVSAVIKTLLQAETFRWGFDGCDPKGNCLKNCV